MSRYTVELLTAAKRQPKKLPPKAQTQVLSVLEQLADNPHPHGYKPLHGKLKDLLRIDTGNYRVLYEVRDKILVIVALRIGDRRDVYR